MSDRKGFVGLLYLALILGILIAVIYGIYMITSIATGSGLVDAANDAFNSLGTTLGIVNTRDYIIEVSGVQVTTQNPKEGSDITVHATFVCDYDEPCTFVARAALEPQDSYVPGTFISVARSVCCPDRKSEATETITLEPDDYATVEFHMKVPVSGETSTCRGSVTSYYSSSQVYYLKVSAYDGCYGRQLIDLAPVRVDVEASPGASIPVSYKTPDRTDGANINHYFDDVKADGVSCTALSGYDGYAFECPYGTYLHVTTKLKNNDDDGLKFLTEGILLPAESYDPMNVLGTFLQATRSCCGDPFSQGRWIQASPGAYSDVGYAVLIPHGNTYGKCNPRDYYSPSKTYYFKISDYTDCGGTQVQDIAPILVRFR